MMNSEKCRVCGAVVRKENLRGHYERIHPKRVGSLGQARGSMGKGSFVRSHRNRNILALVVLALVVVGVAFAASEFASAPGSSSEGMHIHPVVSAMINGVAWEVPSEIGINQGLWVDRSLDRYGIGMAPLHTHDNSGTVHVESNAVRDFTLQEFLGIWGKSVDPGQVLGHQVEPGHRAYILVNGVEKPVTETVILSDEQQIQITCAP